jgi:hypothetical protein
MKILLQCHLIILAVSCFNIAYADNLGRLFTTAEERQKLEKIRQRVEPEDNFETVKVEKVVEPVMPEKEVVQREEIYLKGLVHRSDGKSTAWINDSNTFDGDLESQFIQVSDEQIKSDQVTIIMPDDSTHVELKVGEAFTPEPIVRGTLDIEGN